MQRSPRPVMAVMAALAFALAACSNSTEQAGSSTTTSATTSSTSPITTTTSTSLVTTTEAPTTTTTTEAPTTTSSTKPATTAAPVCVPPLAKWTASAKAAQLLIVRARFGNLSASTAQAAAGVGGFVLLGQPSSGAATQVRTGIAALARAARQKGHATPWFTTDEEGGDIARLKDILGPLPSARQMAATMSPEQARAMVADHARSMRALGVDVDLAPVLDVADPSNTIASEDQRSFSADPAVAARYGRAFAAGLTEGGVVPVAKHFPGLGHASANTDLKPAEDPPLDVLQVRDLLPFQSLIDFGIPVVMVGNMSVPGLTSGLPASLASTTYTLLRGPMHFKGVAITDALNVGSIAATGYSQSHAAVLAIRAGADMAMIDELSWSATVQELRSVMAKGTLAAATVNAAITRILEAKHVAICGA